MRVEFDPVKRQATLERRGLDMASVPAAFEGPHLTFVDDRMDYGEERLITFGLLDGRMVCFAWTQRGDVRRIISMRKCNEREVRRYGARLGL